MKTIKQFLGASLLFAILASFSQCSSTQKIQEKPPTAIGQVYFQKWVAGVRGGGAGLNIFIPVNDTAIKLDSVYFKGKSAKLEIKPGKNIFYVGRFISDINQKKDIIMSSEPHAEFNNPKPKLAKKIPFQLKHNECIISYIQDDKIKYFKIDNVVEKKLIPYPSAPPNRQ
jgi:hypothetical protein